MRVARRHLSGLGKPQPLGWLAEKDDMPVIRASTVTGESQFNGEQPSLQYPPRDARLDPRTRLARSPSPRMMRLSEHLSSTVSSMTIGHDPQLLRQQVSRLYRRLQAGEPQRPSLESIDVEAHITGLFLQNWASVRSALLELKQRRPGFVPESVLDVGYGPAPGLLVSREIWPQISESESDKPRREVAIVLGHPRMKRRAKELLAAESQRPLADETVVLRDSVPTDRSPGRYDLIVATHQLYRAGPYSKEMVDSHSKQLASLLNPGGVLVLVERGDPVGFEAVARAREVLLRRQSNNSVFGVVAPCPHSERCPLQQGLFSRQSARNPAGQNWCRFSQRVHRPRFAVELKKGQYLAQPWVPNEDPTHDFGRGRGGKSLAGSGRPGGNSHEVANFSYVAIEKPRDKGSMAKEDISADEPSMHNSDTHGTPVSDEPRILKPPLKRDGHVIMEMCTPTGRIEQWTVPRSQGRQAYHDARKADQGDLWALDAKVKQARGGLRRPPGPDEPPRADNSPRIDWWEAGTGSSNGDTNEASVLESLRLVAERDRKLAAKERQNVYGRF